MNINFFKNIPYGEKEIQRYKAKFKKTGILILPGFLGKSDITNITQEAGKLFPQSYKSSTRYNLFVEDTEGTNLAKKRLSRITFNTQKSCICTDQIPKKSLLKQLYYSNDFQNFLCCILNQEQLFPYIDTLSSININYYDPGDSLEWHFDNCEFTVTLLIKKPDAGGMYQYFTDQRYKKSGEEDYESIEKMLSGEMKSEEVDIEAGDLILFRGTESLHRVTEITGGQRILVTFCYNTRPGISLSEKSRMTFFGRLGE